MPKKKPAFRGVENKPYVEGMRELRRSSAAGTHQDKRTKRNRTRLAATSRAVKDSNQ